MELFQTEVTVFVAGTLYDFDPSIRLEQPGSLVIAQDTLEFERDAEKEDLLEYYAHLVAPEAFSYPIDSWSSVGLVFDGQTTIADMRLDTVKRIIIIIHPRMLRPELRDALIPEVRKWLEVPTKERKKHIVRAVG